MSKIKHVIGVMSGKGGVGKSTVAYLIAKELNRQGFKVGIMDADITGPSIPKLLDLKPTQLYAQDNKMLPYETDSGMKVISMNFMLEDETQPVIWRGPLLGKVINQFWDDVAWGELDYLVIDLPPGTSDVSLTVMQSYPLDGLVVVTTPSEVASLIVLKSIKMAEMMKKKILGLVENMSFLKCPECGKKIELFERGEHYQKLIDNWGILFSLPIRTEIANATQLTEDIAAIVEKGVKDIIAKLSQDEVEK
jgi:Mrp family chromosome partitioning ATPase